MSQPLTLANLLDDAALLSFEHQLHLAEVVGEHQWHVDLSAPRFEFRGENPLVATRVHLLGSAAPGPSSWLWSWANPSGYSKAVTGLAESVAEFGRKHGIAPLASGEVPFDAFPAAQGDPNLVAATILEAAKPVSNVWTSYTGDVGGGTRAAFLIEHPSFRLPAPEPARVVRVLQQSVADLPLTDHRRAFHSYGTRRALKPEFSADHSKLRFTGPRFTVITEFDDAGRVSGMTSNLGAEQ